MVSTPPGLFLHFDGRLSLHGLRVVSQTSGSRFEGGHQSLPDIARALRVEGVIEGSVGRAGKVRITTQLIEASIDRHLWAGTYEDSTDEVIALQDRVARDVAREVRAAVRPESSPPSVSARGPSSLWPFRVGSLLAPGTARFARSTRRGLVSTAEIGSCF